MTPPNYSPFASLPGTEAVQRGIFVDRWGTLLELPENGRCTQFGKASFIQGTLDALFRAQQAGWGLYLIGNEEHVAMGRMARSTWERFEAELLEHLCAHGIDVKRSYACCDHPEGKGEHRRPSVFCLPDTGLLYHAAQVDGVLLEHSWVVGDGRNELAAGGRAGCGTIAVLSGEGLGSSGLDIEPNLIVPSLSEAVDYLLGVPVERC